MEKYFLFDYFKPDSNKICHASPYFLNWGLSHVLSFSFPTQDLFIFTFATFHLLLSLPTSCIPTILLSGCITVWTFVSRLASPKLCWISIPCSLMPPLVKRVTSNQTHVPSTSDFGEILLCWTGHRFHSLFWCMDLMIPVWIATLCREVVARVLADLVEYVWTLFHAVMNGTSLEGWKIFTILLRDHWPWPRDLSWENWAAK